MPGSIGENHPYTQSILKRIFNEFRVNNPKKIFKFCDIGPGMGTYGKLFNELNPTMYTSTAVEVWEPYVEMFRLEQIYDVVHVQDAKDFFIEIDGSYSKYNVIVFGDVLEHMTKEESLNCFKKACEFSDYTIVSIPIVHWPQGEEYGNPYEVHVQEHISVEDALEMFGTPWQSQIGEYTGVFIYKNEIR